MRTYQMCSRLALVLAYDKPCIVGKDGKCRTIAEDILASMKDRYRSRGSDGK